MTGLFGRKPATPAPVAPVVAPPAAMPDPEDPGVIEAKRRAQREAMSRGGRASTILTGKSSSANTAGGGGAAPSFDSYSGANLGSGT